MGGLIQARRKILLNTPHLATASGSMIRMNNAESALMKRCIVYYTPKQEGSGQAWIDNIRPIVGRYLLPITVSPTQNAQDGITYTLRQGYPRYTGYVDLISGIVTITHTCATLTGNESGASWSWNGYTFIKSDTISNNPQKHVTNCSHTDQCVSGSVYYNQQDSTDSRYMVMCCTSVGRQMRFRNRFVSDPYETNDKKLSAMKAWLQEQNAAGTPVQIVYELETPAILTYTPVIVRTRGGINNIWSEAGDVEIEYWAH